MPVVPNQTRSFILSNTAVRYLTMLRMVPRYPKSITTTELAQRLEEQDFSVTMRSIQRDLEKLSADFPLLVDESAALWANGRTVCA